MQKFNKYDFDVELGFEFEIDFSTIKLKDFAEIILTLTNYKSSNNYCGVVDFKTVQGTNIIIVCFNSETPKEKCFELLKTIINNIDFELQGYTLEYTGECELVSFNGMYDLEQQGIIKDSSTARLIGNGDGF